MVGLSTPSGEHSHRVAPPPDPSVPTPCREAPAPELPGRFAAARIDRQAAACRQRIGTDRVGEEGKCPPPPGFCPGYRLNSGNQPLAPQTGLNFVSSFNIMHLRYRTV